MLRCGFRRRLTSFATGAVERRLSSFTKTTAGAVELKISASGLFSSDSTLLRARIFDTPTGQACLRPPSATVSPRTKAEMAAPVYAGCSRCGVCPLLSTHLNDASGRARVSCGAGQCERGYAERATHAATKDAI